MFKPFGMPLWYLCAFVVTELQACTKREFWLFWGDKTALYTKAFIIIANALIVGSLCKFALIRHLARRSWYGPSVYDQPSDTSGAFSRGGTAFFSIVFLGWLQLSELLKAVSGRVVIARHKEYALYRPRYVRCFPDFRCSRAGGLTRS